MRVVLHNPHTLWFKNTFACFLANTKNINKYDYFFDYLYERPAKTIVYIDHCSSAPLFKGFLRLLNVPVVEFYAWVLINRLNPFKFKLISNVNCLSSSDVVITFLYDQFTNVSGTLGAPITDLIENLKKTSALKVMHLSHYAYNVGLGSKNAQAAGIDLLVSENDLAKNSSFFKSHYSWYKEGVYVLPFVPSIRFVKKRPFCDRVNKALATGTITHDMIDTDFTSYFNSNKLQPMRHEIFANQENLSQCIDSLITKITSTANHSAHKVFADTPSLVQALKSLRAFQVVASTKKDISIILKIISFLITGKSGSSLKNERDYYKLDIVQKYNEYKMFVVPEEIIDLPAIGFVEGMACGCAYLGVRAPMYSDLGLLDAENYIAYDGTMKDLVDKISYYQKHHDELKRIAENGYLFVNESFRADKVVSRFMEFLENIIEIPRRK